MIMRPDELRVLIDCNIIDALVADAPTLELLQRLQAQVAIEVLITFVHVTELDNTPDEERRQLLLTTFTALNPTKVSTPGVYGVTKWDQSTWVGDEYPSPISRRAGGTNSLR